MFTSNANNGRSKDNNLRRQDKGFSPQEDELTNIKKSRGKPKKLKNIDWTKGYEDGLFDDDSFYDEFMR